MDDSTVYRLGLFVLGRFRIRRKIVWPRVLNVSNRKWWLFPESLFSDISISRKVYFGEATAHCVWRKTLCYACRRAVLFMFLWQLFIVGTFEHNPNDVTPLLDNIVLILKTKWNDFWYEQVNGSGLTGTLLFQLLVAWFENMKYVETQGASNVVYCECETNTKGLLRGVGLDYTTFLFFLFDRLINRKVKCESFSTL